MNTKQKSVNTKQKAKISINLIDIITVIALIAGLAVAGLGIYHSLSTAGEQVRIRYVIESEPMDDSFTSKVNVGDGVYDFESSRQIGTVRSASAASAGQSSAEKVAEGAKKSILYITAETTAVRTSTGYAAGGTLINVGRELELRMPDLFCSGRCISIEIIKE